MQSIEFTVATDLETTSTEESVSAGLGDSTSTAGNGSFTVSIASLDFLGFRAQSFVGYHTSRKGQKNGKKIFTKFFTMEINSRRKGTYKKNTKDYCE